MTVYMNVYYTFIWKAIALKNSHFKGFFILALLCIRFRYYHGSNSLEAKRIKIQLSAKFD